MAGKGKMETHQHTFETQEPELNYLTKIDLLMAYVTAVGSSKRAQSTVFWVIFDIFRPMLPTFVVREPLGDLEIQS